MELAHQRIWSPVLSPDGCNPVCEGGAHDAAECVGWCGSTTACCNQISYPQRQFSVAVVHKRRS
jgi:hypothetical protein